FSRKNDIHLAIDPGPDTEDKGRGLPNYLSQIIISPDGKSAWVPSKKDNIQRGKQRDRQALTFESSVRSIVSKIDLQTSKEVLSARHDFNDRDMANAACFSPLGDLLFVASQGSNSVEVLDASNSQILSAVLNTGSAPQGLLVDDQNRLYVHNYLSRTLAVYDISKLLDGSGILETQVAEIKLVKNELLPAALLRGKKTFHFAGDPRMSLDGYISCASCHQDGGQDGRVWDFTDRGEGLRNTISLNGRSGTAHGRLHWSANFDEVQDFEHDIRGPFGGEGLIKDMHNSTIKDFYPSLGQKKAGMSKDLDEMALYVTSLNRVPASPYRSSDGTMTAQAKAGKKIFNKLSCYTCHGGQTYTDSASLYLHDVGTISAATGKRLGKKIPGLDTPTLRGLWATAPYLHDGSAATLKEVLIDKNKKGIHGDTAQLSKAELEELMAYLQQLDESNAPAQSYKPGKIGKSTFVPSFVNSDNVRILKTQVGVSVYSDKDLKLTELPGFLQGSELIQTRDADKKHTYPYALVKFKLDYQSRIFIAFPKIKNKRAPNYHSGWKLEKQSLKINSQEYHLLSKTFAAGPVFLANARNKKFMYFAFIKKDK
ncbi:MAG: c-type cytochrome, partial [Lentisphaeraceae bacterium]|nr:c-type cytochrome [Lentisphaeraceae bacterium]